MALAIHLFPLLCPSLADRAEDIPLIVQHFIQRTCAKNNKNILGLSSQAMEILLQYHWPGGLASAG